MLKNSEQNINKLKEGMIMFNPTVRTTVTFSLQVERTQANIDQTSIWIAQGVNDGEIYVEQIDATTAKSIRFWTTRQAAEEYIRFIVDEYPKDMPPLTYEIEDL